MKILLPTEYQNPKELLELWSQIRNQTLDAFSQISESDFVKIPKENRWTLSQVGEHLYLTQASVAKTIPIVLAKKFGEDMDAQEFLDYAQIKVQLSQPMGVKNPEIVEPKNHYSQSEIISLLAQSHSKLTAVSQNRTKGELQSRGLKHPFFGMLNLFNWIWVMALHENSHLSAIHERIKAML